MDIPDYKKFTNEDLEAVIRVMNGKKYPERLEKAVEELKRRQGEGAKFRISIDDIYFRRKIEWSDVISLWWNYAWRTVLSSISLFMIVNLLLLLFGVDATRLGVRMLFIIIFVMMGIVVLKDILKKDFEKYNIYLVKKSKINQRL